MARGDLRTLTRVEVEGVGFAGVAPGRGAHGLHSPARCTLGLCRALPRCVVQSTEGRGPNMPRGLGRGAERRVESAVRHLPLGSTLPCDDDSVGTGRIASPARHDRRGHLACAGTLISAECA